MLWTMSPAGATQPRIVGPRSRVERVLMRRVRVLDGLVAVLVRSLMDERLDRGVEEVAHDRGGAGHERGTIAADQLDRLGQQIDECRGHEHAGRDTP